MGNNNRIIPQSNMARDIAPQGLPFLKVSVFSEWQRGQAVTMISPQ
jgi:hypothetical protein